MTYMMNGRRGSSDCMVAGVMVSLAAAVGLYAWSPVAPWENTASIERPAVVMPVDESSEKSATRLASERLAEARGVTLPER